MALVRTVAVVVPSPAASFVLDATWNQPEPSSHGAKAIDAAIRECIEEGVAKKMARVWSAVLLKYHKFILRTA